MSIELPLNSMTVSQKLEMMETLWEDLSRSPANIPSPDWHGDVLAERIKAVKEGRVTFQDWEEAKKEIRARFE